jgi:LytS/YehU family sensor histidine kinase
MPPGKKSPGSAYILLQLGGWGLWALLYFALSAAYIPHTPGAMARAGFSYGLAATYGILVTHALYLLLSRAWIKLALPRLLLRIIPSVLAGALVAAAALVLINDRLLNIMGGHVTLPGFLFFACNLAVILTVWVVLYALIYQARQRRLTEQVRTATEIALRKAQYRSLAAQVQPHFLFNSLNTIRALIYENPAEADHAVTRLAALLRAGLRGESRNEHTLAEELLIVEDYLALEKLRFEDRLQASMRVDDAVRSAMLPPMSLQHLVENALKHGIAHLPEGGRVEILAERRGTMLEVSIRNSLPGADAQPFSSASQPSGSAGLGLSNTRERLLLLYGACAGLVQERKNGFMTTRMHLPFVEEASIEGAAD